jgi:ABC-type maltose transport system permease subunit
MNTRILKVIQRLSQSVLLILATVPANSSYAELINPQVLLEKVANTTLNRIN